MSNNDNSASSTPTVSTGAAPGSSFNTSAVTATVAGNESNGSVFQNEDSTIVQQELSDSLNVIKTNKDLAVSAASDAVTAKQQAEAAQTASENAQTAAESAQTAAELALDNLDDKYLGAKTSDPSFDNDGNSLVDGALYFNTTDDILKVYNLASNLWLATKPTDSELTNINTLGSIASDITTVAGISSDVTSVSGISSDVSSVATIAPGVTSVANIDTEVSTVSGIATEIQNVSAVDSHVQTVSQNISDVNTVAGISSNVTTVSDNSANVTTVANNTTDITTVAGISSDVSTVANNTSNINTVANNNTDITTVAGISTDISDVALIDSDVSTVAGIDSSVSTLATVSTDVSSLASISSDISTVSGISGNVTSVAGISTNVTSVANNESNVNTLAGNISDINTLAEVSTDISTLAPQASSISTLSGISSDITTVSGVSTDVTTVSGISSDVSTVSGVASNVTTVAGISSAINTVAGDSAEIASLATITSDITTTASNATDISTVASNITNVNSFADTYSIGATDPATADEGDLFYNTTNNALKYYDGTQWTSLEVQTAQEIANLIDSDTTAESTLKSALGLGTAAYTASTDYATAAQGSTADSALQNVSDDTTPTLGGNLDANNNRLNNVGFIELQQHNTHPTYEEGLLWYDTIHNTLNYYGDESGIVHEVGLEEHQKGYNNSGVQINKGEPIYFSGNFNGQYPTFAKANATNQGKYNAQGIAGHDIPNNSYGYVVTSGLVEGVDTSALFAGTNFFVGLTDGAVQNQSPTYPNYPMCLGWVVKSHATDGILLVNQQNHSVNSFRVQSNTHIGGDLIIDGDLTVVGSQTVASSTNVETGAPFLYLNSGDTIGEANTTFNGSGLDDAYYEGHFSGTTSTTYYVKIDGTGGSRDSFSWSKDNFATTEATNVSISTAGNLLDNGISIKFATLSGHTLNDVWSGTAAPTNVDTGVWSNINTGGTGVGYTHVGMFYDVTDNKFKFVKEYDPEPTGTINTADSSYNAGDLVVNNLDASSATFTGNITITGSGTVDGRDIAADGTKLDGIATNANNYSLPVATTTSLGGVQTGYTTNAASRNYAVSVDASDNAYVNVPWVDNNTTYSVATSSTLGLVEIGYTENGKNYPVELSSNKMFVNVPWTDTNTTYSTATSSTEGLIKIGYSENGKNYPVELNGSNQAFVNVPWTDTDTNTTYSTATSSTLGLVKIGYTENGKNYPVELSSGQMFVNVPWTDNNTTYSVGDGGLTQINFTTTRRDKLDGIESGATADQTASEILTAIKTVDGSGSGLDADNLDGRTWSSTRNSANTLVTRDGNGYTQLGWINTTSGATSSTINKIYCSQDDYIRYLTPANFISQLGLWTSGNDGPSSGLDADTVDGIQASSFIRNDTSNSVTNYANKVTFFSNTNAATTSGSQASLECYSSGAGNDAFMAFHVGGDYATYFGLDGDTNDLFVGGWSKGASRYKIWHAGNDGSSSGLDADTLDGVQGSSYLRSDASDTFTGILTVDGSIGLASQLYHVGDTDTKLTFTTDTITLTAGNQNEITINTTGVRLGDSGNGYFQPVTGSYGSVQIDQGAHNSYEGYSIGGRVVFMHNNGVASGLYNDVNNHWMFYGELNGRTGMYYQGSQKIETTSTGASITGNLTASGDVTAYSDIRLKENVETIDNALAKVKSLRGVTYTKDGKNGLGVIAQEVEEVLPEVVTTNDDEMETKSVAYGNIVGLLIEAIKEQQKEIDELKSKL